MQGPVMWAAAGSGLNSSANPGPGGHSLVWAQRAEPGCFILLGWFGFQQNLMCVLISLYFCIGSFIKSCILTNVE